jgi:rhodanese-related sulfurtransferase
MRTVIVIIFIILSGSRYLSAQIPDSLKYQSLDPHHFQVQYLTDGNSILIDVREFFEFGRTRIKGAVNIPSSANLEMTADTIDKNASLFLYCYSGTRSKKVARFFYDKGFRKLYSLEGGIVLWKKEKMPVEKKRLRRKQGM